jgi:hypothetical protein
MSSTGPTDTPPFSDSDQQWHAALSGELGPENATPAVREGLGLRMALEARRQALEADPALAAVIDDAAALRQLASLRQRLAREGVFDRPQPSAAPAPAPVPTPDPTPAPVPPPATAQVIAFPWWRRRTALVAMAASVLLAVVVLRQLGTGPDYPPPQVMQGTGGVQAVRSAQPRQAAEALAAQLRQAGLRPGIFQRGGVYGVDISLLAAELPAATPAFAALGLQPVPGFNRVEISGL